MNYVMYESLKVKVRR